MKLKTVRAFSVYLMFAAFAGTPALAARFTGNVTYKDSRFGPEQLSSNTLFVFPIVNNGVFDTNNAISDMVVGDWLLKRRNDIAPVYKDSLDIIIQSKYPEKVMGLYDNLLNRNQKNLQADSLFWALLNSEYALFIYVRYSGKIKNADKSIIRNMRMESEIWSVNPPGIMWRAEVTGSEKRSKTSDIDFIRAGIEKLISMFPSYYPVIRDNNW
jgi:hypothetical protein